MSYQPVSETILVSEICINSKACTDYFDRWPATRVQKNGASLSDLGLTMAGAADAAVWIKPKCASSVSQAVCVSEFQGAACYPYCMALRAKGSGSSRLILFNEPNWKVNLLCTGFYLQVLLLYIFSVQYVTFVAICFVFVGVCPPHEPRLPASNQRSSVTG